MICSSSDALVVNEVQRISEDGEELLPATGERPLPFAQLLNIDLFCDTQRIFQLDTEVSHCAVNLGVAKQKLNGTQIARLPVNQRCLGPSE